jgi:hypothetical protein
MQHTRESKEMHLKFWSEKLMGGDQLGELGINEWKII